MTSAPTFRQRLHGLRERLRRDPARPRRWTAPRWLLPATLGLAIAGTAAADVWLYTCGFEGCPSGREIQAYRPTEGGRILDRRGRLLGYLSPVRRVNVTLDEVPDHVWQAFVATEDRRFFEHDGLDMRSAARAIARDVASLSFKEGFSTITMQVARNAFVPDRFSRRSIARKLMELRLARLLERHLTKEEILALYLNVIYLGNGTYGVEAASRDLFGKNVSELTVPEAAVLAALPKGPSAYTPRRHPERARARRDLVLGLMAREGYITRAEAERHRATKLAISREEWRPDRPDDSFALDAVRQLVDSVLEANDIDVGDVTVHTTLDREAQRAAQRAVQRRARAIESTYGRRGGEPVQGALVAMDPRTGDIRALVGGREYRRGGFNRALAAKRQPGSAFKPFVYAAALEAGLGPATLVDDEPIEVRQGSRIWRPANYGDEYEGRMTFHRALLRSSNAAAVRVSRAVGEPRVIARAQANGIRSPLEPVPAIALGALEVTPLELVAAYAPFANGGDRVTPRLVRRIEAADGTLLWAREIQRAPVMDERDAWELTSMLRGVVDYGTGSAVREWGVDGPVAGKTGTTNDNTDVWFVGYTPSLVAGVWFGYDTPRPLGGGASGGRLAAPAWAEFYRAGWRERDARWRPPAGMVEREIDPETGFLAGSWCPTTRRAWFKPETAPTQYCPVHEAPEPDPFFVDESEPWIEGVGKRMERALRRIFRF